MRCGLLGRTLGHSYSPFIHGQLASYSYELFEKEPQEVEAFIRGGQWDGLNVTVPYKQTAYLLCDAVSDTAKKLGNINTLVRRRDGTIYGDNTDAFGFAQMLRISGICVEGKKTLVLGSGGASHTVCAVLEQMGALVTVISRRGTNTYDNLHLHRDAQVIVNTTPVGMHPHNGDAPLDLAQFPQCQGVLDVIYNPARTALLLQAEQLGISCYNGLYMLVAQAAKSCEQFTGQSVEEDCVDRIYGLLRSKLENIILVGMPGCGKSTVAKILGELLQRPVLECDRLLVQEAGMSVPEIFDRFGQEGFRQRETAMLAQLGRRWGTVISTGGGCITREENYPLLHQNGRIIWIKRDLSALPTEGRPLSQKTSMEEMYALREPLYRRFSDEVVDNNGDSMQTALAIKELIL